MLNRLYINQYARKRKKSDRPSTFRSDAIGDSKDERHLGVIIRDIRAARDTVKKN